MANSGKSTLTALLLVVTLLAGTCAATSRHEKGTSVEIENLTGQEIGCVVGGVLHDGIRFGATAHVAALPIVDLVVHVKVALGVVRTYKLDAVTGLVKSLVGKTVVKIEVTSGHCGSYKDGLVVVLYVKTGLLPPVKVHVCLALQTVVENAIGAVGCTLNGVALPTVSAHGQILIDAHLVVLPLIRLQVKAAATGKVYVLKDKCPAVLTTAGNILARIVVGSAYCGPKLDGLYVSLYVKVGVKAAALTHVKLCLAVAL